MANLKLERGEPEFAGLMSEWTSTPNSANRGSRSPFNRPNTALLPVYTPSPKPSRLRKRKFAGFARSCLLGTLYMALATFLIGLGYVLSNSGIVLTVNIERRTKGLSPFTRERVDFSNSLESPSTLGSQDLGSDLGQQHSPPIEASIEVTKEQQNTQQHVIASSTEISTSPLQQQQQQQIQTSPADIASTDSDIQHGANPVAHMQADPHPEQPSLYTQGFAALNIHGRELHLDELNGTVTLILNVASQCGYTEANYRELETVYERYHDYGFEILAFPCNEFGEQEPKLNYEIEEEMNQRFNISFILMSKISKIQRHPIFSFLRANAPPLPSHEQNEEISWNFNKFLVNKYGHVVKRYPPEVVRHQIELDVYNLLIEKK